ncbi:uncharacterized protein [Amphiura filiformis]|uniref:uncharacterized protein n=1 Tax=Amphiura filiformis TaxID=82378 RepID=UPI003B223CD6
MYQTNAIWREDKMKTSMQILLLALVATSVNSLTVTLLEDPGRMQHTNNGNVLAINPGETITLQCMVSRDRGTGTWTKDGKVISSGDQLLNDNERISLEADISRGRSMYKLKIRGVIQEDAGLYRCVSGSDYDSVNVYVTGAVPDNSGGDIGNGQGGQGDHDTGSVTVRITSVAILSPTSLKVHWQQSGSGSVTGYRVKVNSTRDSIIADASSSARSLDVTGLHAGTTYRVIVYPLNNRVVGKSSGAVTVTTQQERPTGGSNGGSTGGSNGGSSGGSSGGCTTVRPRHIYLSELGTPYLFKGWVDVQGQGANNDYCRIISNAGRPQYLSCALAGSTGNAVYTSPAGYFDAGHTDTWYMKDADGDGRDDYCRCVGLPPNTVVSCLKAGENGFTSDFAIPDSNGCHYRKVDPFFGEPINCAV